MTDDEKPKPRKVDRVIICALCNGYGKTFGVRGSLTCVECGGSGLLRIVDSKTVRKVPLLKEIKYSWYEFDYTGEHRSRSLERNGVISFSDIEFDEEDGDGILWE